MPAQESFISPKDLIEGDFFELAGLQNLPEEEKEELIEQIIRSIEDRVVLRIDDMLQPGDRPAFYELLDKENDEEINKFLKEKGIDVPRLTIEEALLQKNTLLQRLKELKNITKE